MVLALCALCTPGDAWMRLIYEDATVLERSELVVVGHLKEGSIVYVPHGEEPASSHEHHATLTVAGVLKGKLERKEIPIIIHYGLTPVVGGYAKQENFMVNKRGRRKDYPKDIVEVIDTGNSAFSLKSLVRDARKDNLWFLRRLSGRSGQQRSTAKFGIADPEDLRSIELKNYFLAYLSENPEPIVRKYAEGSSRRARAAKRYLAHLEIQRILKIEDIQERLKRLLPHYLGRQTWNGKQEARDALISCGDGGGDLLMTLFDDPRYEALRPDMILVFRESGCKACAPRLVRLLEAHRQFWAERPIYKGRWNHGRDAQDEKTRGRFYSEVYYSAYALSALGDSGATQVIEATKRQWQQDGFASDQIVEECDKFLRRVSKEAKE